MTHRLLSSLATFIVVGLSVCLADAQQPDSTTASNRTSIEAHEKAFELLESLAGQIPSLRSAENRARLGSNIAESLWDHDEKRARSLFASVEADIRAGLEQAQAGEVEDEKARMVFVHLRMDTIKRIAKHDPQLALEFMKSTQSASDTRASYALAEMERNLELDLARETAASNPEIALKIGRREVERGYSYQLLSLLSRLVRKHRAEGAILYHEVVLALRDSDMSNVETSDFAIDLAQSVSATAVEESDFRELINLIITVASSRGCGKIDEDNQRAWFCRRIGTIIPQIERVDAARAAELRRWYEDPESVWPSEGYEELAETVQSGSVDEVLALASRYPQLDREIYVAAIKKAQAQGDLERARKIASDYHGNPGTQAELRAQVDRAQIFAEKKDEILDDIQKKLGATRGAREQVGLLLFSADQIGTIDQKTSLKLLSQANDIVNSMKTDKDQIQLQLVLAAMYCVQKSDRGLALMESLLPRINTLVAAAAQLDGYENNYLREGEWNMSSEGGVGRLLTGLAENAGSFAWCDLNRAVTAAGQFERTELRMMAQMKLAQAILAGPAKRQLFREDW